MRQFVVVCKSVDRPILSECKQFPNEGGSMFSLSLSLTLHRNARSQSKRAEIDYKNAQLVAEKLACFALQQIIVIIGNLNKSEQNLEKRTCRVQQTIEKSLALNSEEDNLQLQSAAIMIVFCENPAKNRVQRPPTKS
jgi:hypothetical protein